MFGVEKYQRPNGECPFEDYRGVVEASGQKTTKIDVCVNHLAQWGSAKLQETKMADHIGGDLWELRPKPHRIFYFFDNSRQGYVLLNGYRKKTRKTPEQEIEQAERLMDEYYRSEQKGGTLP